MACSSFCEHKQRRSASLPVGHGDRVLDHGYQRFHMQQILVQGGIYEQLMTMSIRCKRGSLSRNDTESRNLNSRHRKSSCNGLDGGEKNRLIRLQSFLSKEYILSRVFRKDGPLLGLEFDHPPANAPGGFADIAYSHCCQDEQRVRKRRKVLKTHAADSSVGIHTKNVPEKKHGKGKALMTVWRACQSSNGKFPRGLKYFDGKVNCFPYMPSVKAQIQKQGKSKKKVPKKPPRRRKVLGNMDDANFVEPRHPECKLIIDETQVMYQSKSFTPLIDDEELELLESEEASTAFRCCAHLCSTGEEACPLCKDVLARFPPKIVKMKQPITTTPWDSSPELVKKLFKVFQFLYNHATAIELCYFTLDDLAQAFSDKDSLLLGKVHVGLLKLLLLSAEREISSGFVSRSSKDCRFLSFLQSKNRRKPFCKEASALTWQEEVKTLPRGFSQQLQLLHEGLLGLKIVEGTPTSAGIDHLLLNWCRFCCWERRRVPAVTNPRSAA
ncbi:hypothetical protein KSP39_PZI003978 [Platanthera zijinensis]|uniref:DDT domain-containing protein n=1 Tax=Platanthera zijinensis TaxID=2320716 RepID=A0AAP0GC85_9ASPA